MRLSFLTVAATAAFALVVSVGDASACHKKRGCATPCAVAPAPVCAPAPVARVHKKKCFGGHKNRQVCAAPVGGCGGAPMFDGGYGGPGYPTGQGVYPTGQGY